MATKVEDLQAGSPQEPVATPGGRFTVPDRVWTVIVAATALGIAEVVAANEWVSRLILPAPTAVWNAIVSGFSTGIYWPHIFSTLYATTAGFLMAAVVSIVVAGILASFPRLERIFYPFIIALQTMPKIAIAPLIVLWLGFGNMGKTTIVALICFFPILVNSLQGLRVRDRDQYELTRSLGASTYQLFRYIRVPNAVPYIFAGLHIGIIFALIGAVVAEFVGSRAGLGYLLLSQKAAFNVPGVYANLLLLMVLGLTYHGIMVALEKRIAFWTRDISVVSA
jgi:NitT/TauT family transport system permease protein